MQILVDEEVLPQHLQTRAVKCKATNGAWLDSLDHRREEASAPCDMQERQLGALELIGLVGDGL